ncbi:MAG: cytochrome c biogenesis CcdA family protein [Actinomycetota bacterium]
MVEVSLLASFLGGVLSLLSPCSALLVPAFFAYAFGSGGELAKKTGLFYAGLCATLVPLGMGVSAVSSLFYGQRELLVVVAGGVLISLGLLQILGGGFGFGPLSRLGGAIRGDSAASVFALGAVYGFAGFCSGPILGAVLTVAAASGEALRGAALLAVYALGMALPLFVMASLWDRLDLGRRRWLRGKEMRLGPFRVHTTNLVSGLVFAGLGAAFIAYEGTSALSGLYAAAGAEDLTLAAQQRISSLPGGALEIAVLAGVAAVVIALRAMLHRRESSKR